MNTATAPILIRYSGRAVSIDRRRITQEMSVPNLGRDDPSHADEFPGDVVASLFEQAKTTRALVVPDDLRAECYADNDELRGGFILAVYSTRGSAGVTCGWRDVENITRLEGDPRPDNDRRVVADALRFMAGEINAALGVKPGQSSEG